MVVTVEFIGAQRAVTKTGRVILTVPEKATAGDILEQVLMQYPGLPLEKEAALITVNHAPVRSDAGLKDQDVVCLLPHIGGG